MKAPCYILLYALILTILNSCSGVNKAETIGIQVLGSFNEKEVMHLQNVLSKSFDIKVIVLPSDKLPTEAYVNIKSPRYRADKLIKILKEQKADSIDYVLGLTSSDISFTKKDAFGRVKKPESKYKDWGIFGLGYRPGPSCIVSSYRLKHSNYSIYQDRLIKVCTHELGHNMGLPHCEIKGCVMQDAAETIKTIDRVNVEFCSSCKIKVQ
ncbi:hypothetical protein GYB22_11255 [bacterium]|nr:hypothetical protein [bacterium]